MFLVTKNISSPKNVFLIFRKGIPIYVRSVSNIEMWPCLLEKAYAKAKGSYELLNHWLPIDG